MILKSLMAVMVIGLWLACAPSVWAETVSWNANTEPDLNGYNLLRCTGVACTPSVILSTLPASSTSYLESALAPSTTYGYRINAFDGSGNQSPYSATVYVTTAAGPPPTPPTIATSTVDATGADLTWTGPPVTIRVETTTGGTITSVVEPLSNFPAGRYTYTWPAGSTSVCFYARDAAGVDTVTASDFQCDSLVGIAPALDTTAPIVSNGSPSATLPFGTTSAVMSVTTDESATCRYSDVDAAFSAMELSMNSLSLTSSVTLTGLTDGSSTIYYVRCVDGSGNANTNSLAITVAVAAAPAGDVTPPSTVASLVATALSQSQVSLTWGAATDNVAVAGYAVSSCAGAGCSTYSLVAAPVVATTLVLSLTPLTSYSFVVRAIDTSGNLSVADSNIASVVTQATFDVTPPSTMTNLRQASVFTRSAVLTWDEGSDTQSLITTIIERCTGVECTDFVVVKAQIVSQFVLQFLSPATSYRFRGKHSDAAGNVSMNYSNILDVTTPASGLAQPRHGADRILVTPVSVDRLPRESVSYILTESGDRITLEDDGGSALTEASAVISPRL